MVVNAAKATLTTTDFDELEKAFKGCNDLRKVFIPSSISTIANSAFAQCGSAVLYCESSSKPSTWPASFIDVDQNHIRWNCTLSDLND